MENLSKFFSFSILVIALVIVWLRPKDQELIKLDTVISSLLKYEQKYVEVTKPRIAIGFGACKDLFVTRAHMIEMMNNSSFPETPANYLGVGDESEFVSMLGYFFQAGAAAERFVHDSDTWSRYRY